jgi:deazaflavin-dependent oxidoreductase (nitroreductase family)
VNRLTRYVLRRLSRAPIALYHRQLGWLVGYRFLLLTHRGRKSGLIRQTVLEVLRYDPITGETIVVSARGQRADWYRNIQASPALQIRTGRESHIPRQHFLSSNEAERFYAEWERRHPIEAWIFPRVLGIRYDGSESARRDLVAAVRLVSFRPRVMLTGS